MSPAQGLAVTGSQTQGHFYACSHGVPGPRSLTRRDDLKLGSLSPSHSQPVTQLRSRPESQAHTRASRSSHTQPHSRAALKRCCAHSQHTRSTLSRSLTLGLSQHPHLRPPGPSAGLQLQQVTPFLPFLCFSFLLFPLRNLVPVRKPKPFPTQGPGPGRSSQMTDKALPGPPALPDLPS